MYIVHNIYLISSENPKKKTFYLYTTKGCILVVVELVAHPAVKFSAIDLLRVLFLSLYIR